MENYRNIPFSPPDITSEEIESVVDTLRSGWITTGPKTKKFENEIARYIGLKKSVCLNSATAALELSLKFYGVGEGDEVITSAYTYTASAAVINHVGATIILVDTAPNSYEMNYDHLESVINERTKAIIPVDIAGVPCDYDRIIKICESKRNIFKPNNIRQSSLGRALVLSDAAHSFGANKNGLKTGLLADISCFSFHAVKNLTTAEGGALVWTQNFGLTDEEVYREFMLLSLHGQTKDALSKTQKGSWEYDIVYLGYKYNMTDIMASIGEVQLKRYDGLLKRRFELIALYERYLDKSKISTLKHKDHSFTSSGHLFICNLLNLEENDRNTIVMRMASRGISTNVHYKPLPLFTVYKSMGFNIKDYKNAYNLYKNEITLPLHTLLSDDDVIYIANTLNSLL
jgi:dTDP-4-amino-4,6-dideoxygalactose transaminase